jgi:hypothetical protein
MRKIHWIDAPHFFKQERVLFLYVGNDEKVQEALKAALGPSFLPDNKSQPVPHQCLGFAAE